MKLGTTLLSVGSVGLLVGGPWACSSTTAEGCFCGTSFLEAVVIVVNNDGEPVTGVAITVTRVSTDESVEFPRNGLPAGVYVIMDDTFVTVLDQAGEVVRVDGRKDQESFQQDYVFGTDECRCHITRVSGPDSVIMDVAAGPSVALQNDDWPAGSSFLSLVRDALK